MPDNARWPKALAVVKMLNSVVMLYGMHLNFYPRYSVNSEYDEKFFKLILGSVVSGSETEILDIFAEDSPSAQKCFNSVFYLNKNVNGPECVKQLNKAKNYNSKI